MISDSRIQRIVAAQPHPLLFATISGAHLYGFPSPDSDYDLRGAHILPVEAVVGLEAKDETIEDSRVIEGLEMDIAITLFGQTGGTIEISAQPNGILLVALSRPRCHAALVLNWAGDSELTLTDREGKHGIKVGSVSTPEHSIVIFRDGQPAWEAP